MKNTFKKGQVYQVIGNVKTDDSIPTKGSKIEIGEIEKKQYRTRINYEVIEGETAKDGSKLFYTDSEFATDLQLIE